MAAVQMTAEVKRMVDKHLAIGTNPMSLLNYLNQSNTISKPEISVEGSDQGPFTVRYRVDNFSAEALGPSKKSARTAAAQKLLEAVIGTSIAKAEKLEPTFQKEEDDTDDIPIYSYDNGAYFDPFSLKDHRLPKKKLAKESQNEHAPFYSMPDEHQQVYFQSDPYSESSYEGFWRTGQADLRRSPPRPMRSTMPQGYPMRRFRPPFRLAQPYPMRNFQQAKPEDNVGGFRDPGGFHDRDPEVGGFRDPNVGGFRDPKAGGFRDPNAGGFRDPNVGGFREPNVGGFREPNVGGFREPNVGGFRYPNAGGLCDPNASGFRDPNLGGYHDPNVGGFRDLNVGGFRSPNLSGYRDPDVGGFRDLNVGGYRNLKAGGFHGPNMGSLRDPFSQLNTIAMQRFNLVPRVEVCSDATDGFGCVIKLEDYEAYGTGISKKLAKQNASVEMLRILRE